MRIVRGADTQPCFDCGVRADVVVARGHRTWYACWEHAPDLLQAGGVIVGQGLEGRRG